MIETTTKSEFGSYKQKKNHGYSVHSDYFCIDAYKDVPEDKHWEKCPCCGLKPKLKALCLYIFAATEICKSTAQINYA